MHLADEISLQTYFGKIEEIKSEPIKSQKIVLKFFDETFWDFIRKVPKYDDRKRAPVYADTYKKKN